MEATSQRPVAAEPAPVAPDDPSGCLAALVERWADAGAAVPVAIVVSVFDDVLPALAEDGRTDSDLDAIVVDAEGHACLREPIDLSAASRLLIRALGDDVPSGARPFVTRLADGDEAGPVDGEQLRQWMRDALGAPASREEVCAAFAALDDSEAETLLPAPAVVDDVDDDEELETLPPPPTSDLPVPPLVNESDEVMIAVAGEAPLPPERPHDTMIDRQPPAFVAASVKPEADASPPPVPEASIPAAPAAERKVVRHTYNPKTVSLPSAPAARRSARAATAGPDSILIPNERRTSYGWLVVFGVIAAVVYVLFFR